MPAAGGIADGILAPGAAGPGGYGMGAPGPAGAGPAPGFARPSRAFRSAISRAGFFGWSKEVLPRVEEKSKDRKGA